MTSTNSSSFHNTVPIKEMRDLCGEPEAEARGRLDGARIALDTLRALRLELRGPEVAVSIFAIASVVGNFYGVDLDLRSAQERTVAFATKGLGVEVVPLHAEDARPVGGLCIDQHRLRIAPLVPGVEYVLRVISPPPAVLRLATPLDVAPSASPDDSHCGFPFEAASFSPRRLAMA